MTHEMPPLEKELFLLTNRVIASENQANQIKKALDNAGTRLKELEDQRQEQSLINGELRVKLNRLDLAMGAYADLDKRVEDIQKGHGKAIDDIIKGKYNKKPSLADRIFSFFNKK